MAAARAAARRIAAEALAGGELPEGFGEEEINIFLAEAQARAEAEAAGAFNPLLGEAGVARVATDGDAAALMENPFLAEDEEDEDDDDELPALEEVAVEAETKA